MIGETLSSYTILDTLGTGGMGTVYKAEVAEPEAGLDKGERVALKVIHPHLLESKGFFKRFMREAQVGQRVQHENVVKTHDCDATMHGGQQQNFLVMEYVEGQTLRDLLQELGSLPEELCRHIGCEMAKALVAIHAAGVVHRDLKPENVLITEDEVIKVMDLGVARLQDEVIRLSQTGAFVGSLQYAAPEQFKGGGKDIDGRADLHALGAMLYELSTGRHPFHDEDTRVVLRRVLTEDPRRLGEINPQLSPFYEEIVHKLLAKEKEDRFDSPETLLEIFEQGEESEWWKEHARSLRVETQQPLRRIRIPRDTALYGRDDEIARLTELFQKAKAGEGQAVLLEGEAGIGRTRLVDEFVGQMRQQGEDLQFLFGEYPPSGAATASGAFSTAYREHFGAEGLEETLETTLAQSPMVIPAFAALLRGDPTPKGEEPLTKDSLQTLFVHVTRALAAERTTVVLIDDLHYAPEDGRALFASLALGVPDHRVLLVATTRPGIEEEWVTGLERQQHFTRMTLERLGAKDVGQLLVDAFQSQRLADELGFQIVTKADGNPFFVFEIVRGLREGKLISQTDDGSWARTQVIDEILIPSSVTDLIEARVSDLSDDEREVLDVAACAGYTFDPSVVAGALDLGIVPALKRFAKIEKAHRLIRSEGRRYVFDHHQIQESLYAGLFEQLREQYHLAIAGALEKKHKGLDVDPGTLPGALTVDLAEHYFNGAAPENAARYLGAAMDYLERGYLNDAAIQLADRALEAPGLVAGAERVDLLLRKADRLSQTYLGRPDEQRTVLDEALACAEGLPDPLPAARVGVGLGENLIGMARYADAGPILDDALGRVREAGDKALEAKATRLQGNVFFFQQKHAEAVPYYERAIVMAREAGDKLEEAGNTNNLANMLQTTEGPERAQELYEKSLEIARAHGIRIIEGIASGNLAGVLADAGQVERARELTLAALAAAREVGSRKDEAFALAALSGFNIREGRLSLGLEDAELSLALSREMSRGDGESSMGRRLGRLLLRLGDCDRAHREYETTLEVAVRFESTPDQALSRSGLASAAEQRGDLDQAAAYYEETLISQRGLESKSAVAETLAALGRCLAKAGRFDEARTRLEEAVTIATEEDAPATLLLAHAVLGTLPGGDPAPALAVLEEHRHRLGVEDRMEARYLLWKATKESEHIEHARKHLDLLVENAPAEYRESMLANVPLHRDIMRASGGTS